MWSDASVVLHCVSIHSQVFMLLELGPVGVNSPVLYIKLPGVYQCTVRSGLGLFDGQCGAYL